MISHFNHHYAPTRTTIVTALDKAGLLRSKSLFFIIKTAISSRSSTVAYLSPVVISEVAFCRTCVPFFFRRRNIFTSRCRGLSRFIDDRWAPRSYYKSSRRYKRVPIMKSSKGFKKWSIIRVIHVFKDVPGGLSYFLP